MDKQLLIKVDDSKFSTGMVLDLMDLQSKLTGENASQALRAMVTLLQEAVVSIEYDGKAMGSLLELPFRKLQAAMSQIMDVVNQTDPN